MLNITSEQPTLPSGLRDLNLTRALDLVGEPIMMVGSDERIIWCNNALLDESGFAADQLLCMPAKNIVYGQDPLWSYKNMAPRISGTSIRRQSTMLRADAQAYPVDETITAIADTAGGALHYLSVLHDISGSQLALQAARNRASHDALTGVSSRGELLTMLQQEFTNASKHGEELGLLFIDLDGFKSINDRFGHQVGDSLLRTVGARLRASVRATDIVGRYGGDEFVVVLPHPARLSAVEQIGKKLVEQLSQPYALPFGQLRLGASIGLAIYPHDAVECAALLAKADSAMYRAKSQGGSQLVLASSNDKALIPPIMPPKEVESTHKTSCRGLAESLLPALLRASTTQIHAPQALAFQHPTAESST